MSRDVSRPIPTFTGLFVLFHTLHVYVLLFSVSVQILACILLSSYCQGLQRKNFIIFRKEIN